jgi:hypothetical protein
VKLLLESRHALTDCRVIIDDDGRVAYAYLLDPDGTIVGDVWLYNRLPPTDEIDFEGGAPFLNPHAQSPDQPLPTTPAELSVEWLMDDALLVAEVRLRGAPLARLTPGSQPGWHAWALNGPLARPFER